MVALSSQSISPKIMIVGPDATAGVMSRMKGKMPVFTVGRESTPGCSCVREVEREGDGDAPARVMTR